MQEKNANGIYNLGYTIRLYTNYVNLYLKLLDELVFKFEAYPSSVGG